MASIVLGTVPLDITVTLARGGNFLTVLESSEAWPNGITIELHFATATTESALDAATVWPASIDATTATWNIDAEDVDEVIAAKKKFVRLHCVDELSDILVWAKGETNVI